jgi:hypothetical protein
MPFENFEKEFNKTDGNWQIGFGAVFIGLFLYGMVCFFGAIFPASTEPVKEGSTESERLRNVDALCSGLPKPEKFYYISREVAPSKKKNTTAVLYSYQSSRTPDEIMPAFVLWLGENGWKPDEYDKTSFRKGDQQIVMSHTNRSFVDKVDKTIPAAKSIVPIPDYQIFCLERSPDPLSFEIYD